MERFVTSIESSLKSKNWFAALFMALAMPDICGALENPDRAVGERYKDWFGRFLKNAYYPENQYDHLQYHAPDVLKKLPDHVIENMKVEPVPDGTAFTAEDCYRLRCKCLHQGLPERMGEDRVHFTAPDTTGRISVHLNNIDGVLQISIDQFCKDVARAVIVWWNKAKEEPAIATRAQQLIRIYGLDAQELPIVNYGVL